MPNIATSILYSRAALCSLLVLTSLLSIAAGPTPASAEVLRFDIHQREPFAGGQAFGDSGPYERISGTVHYRLPAAHARNAPIRDLSLAARDEEGYVHFSADLFLLAPRDPRKGNGALLYDVNNRGNKLALRFFNDAPSGNGAKEAGHGFLMRRGYTVVWSGWDGELLPGDARLRLVAPVARRDGKAITGRVRYVLVPKEASTRLPVNRANQGAYRPAQGGPSTATLTWRLRSDDRRVPIPRTQFRLHVTDQAADGLPLVELELPAGFRPGYLYELTYEAQDPLVHGVCFAAVRDLLSALKHGEGGDNPLLVEGQSVYDRALGFGVSQSGRFLREMLYWGFNRDEQDRRVFAGVMPHVAGGGLGSFNHRFAQPTVFATQHENHDSVTDRFPFAYATQLDPLSKRRDGILRRSLADKQTPYVLHTQSSTEYWSRCGSLVHTDALGREDAELPDCVRLYAFGGTQHGPGGYPPRAGQGQTPANPADYRPLLRALLVALDAWCQGTQDPPHSVYPRLAKGTLVDWRQPSTGFPALPGVRYPEVIHQARLYDFGSRWHKAGIIDLLPPKRAGSYRVLVPRCDRLGNELGCLLPPEVAVPLATFTGWSLRSRESGAENELVGLDGSYLPLPATAAERRASGDPRPSCCELYTDQATYLTRLEACCRQMVEAGYLLAEDLPRLLKRQQERSKDLFTSAGKPAPPANSN